MQVWFLSLGALISPSHADSIYGTHEPRGSGLFVLVRYCCRLLSFGGRFRSWMVPIGRAACQSGISCFLHLYSSTLAPQAHHMFYTAVKDNPCYAGYLWAPFDAFLNVPRLAQFPQDQIWYHSPYARHLNNPAQSESSSKHPHPANVSEMTPQKYLDDATDWGARWQGW